MADDILNVIDGKRDALCDLLAAPYPHGQAKLPSKYHIGCVEEGIAAIDLATAEIERLQAIVAIVDDLHSPRLAHDTCLACDHNWPCPTHLLIHPEEARLG